MKIPAFVLAAFVTIVAEVAGALVVVALIELARWIGGVL